MTAEAASRFRCFGGDCTVIVGGAGRQGSAPEAVMRARRQLMAWHARFSRFQDDSEISRLNRDPRVAVPASATMLALVAAALQGARVTDGLVDPTLLPALRRAGYDRSRDDALAPVSVGLGELLAQAGPARAATPDPAARWREVRIDSRARTVVRPPGLELDVGGIAKGVFGDLLAASLVDHDSFAVDACGDVRFGGGHTLARPIAVAGPDGTGVVHTLHAQAGAVATSGVGRRAWRQDGGHPAHHLLDPATGRPAFSGLVQVTALAPTGAEAETRAKAALLSGPDAAAGWLADGGVIVDADGQVTVVDPSPAMLACDDRAAVAA